MSHSFSLGPVLSLVFRLAFHVLSRSFLVRLVPSRFALFCLVLSRRAALSLRFASFFLDLSVVFAGSSCFSRLFSLRPVLSRHFWYRLVLSCFVPFILDLSRSFLFRLILSRSVLLCHVVPFFLGISHYFPFRLFFLVCPFLSPSVSSSAVCLELLILSRSF